MSKRTNRVRPLQHEQRQLENLKTLEPITTTPEMMPLANALLDVAIAVIGEVVKLEQNETVSNEDFKTLAAMIDKLPENLPR